VRYCPPDCLTACAWPRDVQLDDRWPASTQLYWALVGLGGDPLDPDRWSTAIDHVERVAGPLAVARGLELAARQPSMAPPDTPVMPPLSDGSPRRGRWWTSQDQQRAAALAEVYRKRAQEVAA
jgi:hypothetical protein